MNNCPNCHHELMLVVMARGSIDKHNEIVCKNCGSYWHEVQSMPMVLYPTEVRRALGLKAISKAYLKSKF